MRRTRSVLTLVLAAAFSLGSLAACSGSSLQPTPPTGGNDDPEDEEEEQVGFQLPSAPTLALDGQVLVVRLA